MTKAGISIHTSREGCDCKYWSSRICCQISIHTSREGCDATTRVLALTRFYFNPHIPWGMWPAFTRSPAFWWRISIHTSREGCDVRRLSLVLSNGGFQSTHPVRDVTQQKYYEDMRNGHFNPHIPWGMWRTESPFWRMMSPISIHTSREGCDDYTATGWPDDQRFQSTHPVRDVTVPAKNKDILFFFQVFSANL